MVFEGHIPEYSIENELLTWKYIEKICDFALVKFPTTMKEDYEILLRDEVRNRLGKNKRYCVKYRYLEKVILYFFKDCAKKVAILSKMNTEDAWNEVKFW